MWRRAPLRVRTGTARAASYQWALPGGRCDDGETAVIAALRELHEELGLRLGPEHVLGLLDDYPTRSGYLVTPVVVWADAGVVVKPNPDEVASVHRIWLEDIERVEAFDFTTIPESARRVIRFRYAGQFIHAPTAAMIYQFREVLAGRGNPRHRAGTAGVCLEVAGGFARKTPRGNLWCDFGLTWRARLLQPGHAASIDSPLVRISCACAGAVGAGRGSHGQEHGQGHRRAGAGNGRCDGAGGIARGDRGIPGGAQGLSTGAGGIRRGRQCLLGRDRRQAAGPQRQAPRSSADRSRRLCADPAAGLYGAEAADQSIA